MRFWGVLVVLWLAAAPHAHSQPQLQFPLMPIPASMKLQTGQLLIDQSFTVAITSHNDSMIEHAVKRFMNDLSRETGMPFTFNSKAKSKTTLLIEAHEGAKVVDVGEDESYQLEVSPSGAKLTAPTSLGVIHGLQTLLQLVRVTPDGFAMPAVSIQDRPRFRWRGLLIDVSRHFMPIEILKRNLDGMAAVKMNVLHLHLSDDQGFRVESKKFPKLQQMGSDGLYYSQDDIRDLLDYARERGIRIIPEFDMPGHTTSWFVGYPELASAPGPYSIERTWGVHDPAMNPTEDKTYRFLDKFIAEMAHLFPDRYFHIGGDEVNGKQWDANPKIQEFKGTHGIKNNQDLQVYFSQHLQKIVSKHGKIMVGWDEILHPDLPKESVVQSWRGQESLAQAAKQGYRGLLSNGYYLDLMWPASRHYAVDPLIGATEGLSLEEKQRILGGEACIWSEYVSPENVDSRIWPRAAAVAERLWSPAEVRDANSMYQRLDLIGSRLELLGLTNRSTYAMMLRRIAGTSEVQPLRIVGDVLEPVKDYTREELSPAPARSTTPLNRMVDAVRPESEVARHFAEAVDALVSGRGESQASNEVRRWLITWQNNSRDLDPLLHQSFLLQEAAPLSRDLSTVSAVGLEALDYIEKHQPAPEAWRTQQESILKEAKKPKAQMLLMIAPSVEKLVRASMGAIASGQPH